MNVMQMIIFTDLQEQFC